MNLTISDIDLRKMFFYLQDPKDAPPKPVIESREQRMERKVSWAHMCAFVKWGGERWEFACGPVL